MGTLPRRWAFPRWMDLEQWAMARTALRSTFASARSPSARRCSPGCSPASNSPAGVRCLLDSYQIVKFKAVRIAATLVVGFCLCAATSCSALEQPTQDAQSVSESAPLPPRQLYQALASLQLDTTKVYSVRDVSIRRDGVEIFLESGELAFLQPVENQITGAVFSGHGRIFAVPPDPAERSSLAQYLKVPLIDVDFAQAYFRFDPATASRIAEQITNQKDPPRSDADLGAAWSPVISGLNLSSTPRIFEGLLSEKPPAYLYGAVSSAQFGGFDVVVDESRAEAVLIGQPRHVNDEDFFNVWTSYKPVNAAIPPDDFATISDTQTTTIEDDLTLDADAVLKLKCLVGGERVLNLELSRFLKVQSVTDVSGNALVFFQNQDIRRQDIARRGNDALYVVLPRQAAP